MKFRVVVFLALLIAGLSQLPDRWVIGCVAIAGSIYILATRPKGEIEVTPAHLRTKSPAAGSPMGNQSKLPSPARPPTVAVTPKPPTLPPPTAVPAAPASAQIVTRTTRGTGQPLIDPFEEHERGWSAGEDLDLLDLYERRQSMTSIAQEMVIDKRQVTIRLIRLLLNSSGDIDDALNASSDGARYESADRAKILADYRRGESLASIASAFGRTQLGIGWQLLESPRRPVAVPDSLIV